jgi:hypothetical protein
MSEKEYIKGYIDLIIRSPKKIYYYEYSDDCGHVFYNGNRSKALRFTEDMLKAFMEGRKLEIKFDKSRLVMYADYSLQEAKKKREEDEIIAVQKKKALEARINEEIKNDDSDLLQFHSFIAECYGSAKPITMFHKSFIYSLRYRNYVILKDALGHGRGWNDASKKFFTLMTGVKLPATKKGIIEVLKDFCGNMVVQ